MAKLYSGDTVDLDDDYQQSSEYQDDKNQWASTMGYCECEDCNNWFENEAKLNEHICSN